MTYSLPSTFRKAKQPLYGSQMKLNYAKNQPFSKIAQKRLILDKLFGGLKNPLCPRGINRRAGQCVHQVKKYEQAKACKKEVRKGEENAQSQSQSCGNSR